MMGRQWFWFRQLSGAIRHQFSAWVRPMLPYVVTRQSYSHIAWNHNTREFDKKNQTRGALLQIIDKPSWASRPVSTWKFMCFMCFEGVGCCIQFSTFVPDFISVHKTKCKDCYRIKCYPNWSWHDVPPKDNVSCDDKASLFLPCNKWHIYGLPFRHNVICQKNYLANAWYVISAGKSGTNLEKHSSPFIYINNTELVSIRIMIYNDKTDVGTPINPRPP